MTEMRYLSTRGKAPPAFYCDAVTAGFAPDGGLYVPPTDSIPQLTDEWFRKAHLKKSPYVDTVCETTFPFVSGIPAGDYRRIISNAFDQSVWGEDPLPMRRLTDRLSVLELFHGPSGAFKDVAMQPVGYEFEYLLNRSGKVITIIVATSGDTGPAAIEAFRGRRGIRVVVFFPKDGTSEFQRKQMTAMASDNIFVIAIDGSFDDCQAIVKELGNRPQLVDELCLSGVNSINWCRVKYQIGYYFHAHASAAQTHHGVVTIVVPSGNFGNAYAGFVSRMMGLPVRIVVATNENKVLAELFSGGVYRPTPAEIKTISPSMNITKASNFERLLYWLVNDDPDRVRAYMQELSSKGFYTLDRAHFRKLRESGIMADFATDAQCIEAMGKVYREHEYIMDPHTAVAYVVAERLLHDSGPVVILSTAAPYKFGRSVHRAIGGYPPRPARFEDLEERPDGPQLAVLSKDPNESERFLRNAMKMAA